MEDRISYILILSPNKFSENISIYLCALVSSIIIVCVLTRRYILLLSHAYIEW